MSFFVSFLISLAISIVMSVISSLLTPPASSIKQSIPSPGEMEGPTADEGIPIPHIRGTRFIDVNCIWWRSTGNSAIIR